MSDLKRTDDLRWGLRWGLYVACGSTALALIGSATGEGIEARLVFQLVGFYFISGLTAGAIIGVLRSRTGSPFGATVTWVIAALPVAAGLCVLAWGVPWRWSAGLVLVWLMFSIYVGLLGTFMFRKLHGLASRNKST
jgi:hypothetical protein